MTKEPTDTKGLNLYQKLAAISGEIGILEKGGRNTEQNFDFIEYAAVAGRLRTLFSKYGVVVVPRMQQAKKQTRQTVTSKYGKQGEAVLIDMTFTVVNADAPDDKFTVTWTGEAIDYGDKATNKAATSALKYYLMRQFNVSEKGEDPDAEAPDRGHNGDTARDTVVTAEPVYVPVDNRQPQTELVSKAQLATMFAAMKGKGYHDKNDATRILRNMGNVASLTELTKGQASDVIAELKAADKAMLDTFLGGDSELTN